MIIWGIVTMGNPDNPTHTKGRNIPGNHVDIGLGPIPEDHIDAETVPTLGGHAGKVILIPKNRVGKDTVHIRTNMLTEVRTLPRIKGLSKQLWMP